MEAGIVLGKLAREVSKIDVPSTRQKRAVYNRLYQEALHASGGLYNGLEFNETLLMIAHNKLVHDENALSYVVLVHDLSP